MKKKVHRIMRCLLVTAACLFITTATVLAYSLVDIGGLEYAVGSGTMEAGTALVCGLTNQRQLSSLTIPSNVSVNGIRYEVTAIETFAFANQTKLKSVVLPEEIKKVGESAFYGDRNLYRIVFPESLEQIGEGLSFGGAFANCSKLKKIVFLGTKVPEFGSSQEFSGISSKVIIYVPKDSIAAYKKAFKKQEMIKGYRIKAYVAVKSIQLTKSVSLSCEGTYQLKPVVVPADATKILSYQSSDSSIVRVGRQGKLTAKKKGTATITVTDVSGAVQTVKVTVN